MHYQQKKEDCLKDLETSKFGLSEIESQKRLKKYGPNQLKKIKTFSKLKLALQQFSDPLVIILILASLISFGIQEYIDAIAILAITLINALIGFTQEYKTEKEIELLQKLSSQTSIVLRHGKKKVDTKNLVPGDILFLEAGDKVPADCRILEDIRLLVDESALTGESNAVSKTSESIDKLNLPLADQKNMLFSGTVIKEGKATAVITSTGMSTEIGKIAHLVQTTIEVTTPLQKKLKHLGKVLGTIILVIALGIFLTGVFFKFPLYDMFLLSISLAISAIPEGLPIIMTLALALSVQIMYKKKTLVRKLKAIETLGSITAICSDKTGTLTKNEMTVVELFTNHKSIKVTGRGYETKGKFLLNNKAIPSKSFETLLEIGASCNNASLPNIGDPTELALIVSAKKANIETRKKISEIPFDSTKKYMSTTHKINNKEITYLKGAPEKILAFCKHIKINNSIRRLSSKDRILILEKNSELSSRALRVLAMAYKTSGKVIFVGLQAMIDPPRKEAKSAMNLCKQAGINVFMITGDNIKTAKAIAKDLDMGTEAIEGSKLDKLSQKELKKIVCSTHIFARVNPSHKAQILKALQSNGAIVAMTGDGVNDAPALKKADIGISMNEKGTDIAKESSDMILMDDNFSSIIKAIKEGRIVYDNIKKFIKYLLSVNFSELLLVLVTLIFKLPLPFIPLQILWINLVTDSLPALALSKEPGDKEVMDRKPRNPKESMLKNISDYILIGGILSFIVMITLFLIEYNTTGNLDKARTITVTASIMYQMFFVFSCKSERSLKEQSIFSNKYLWGAVLITILIQILAIHTPLREVFSFVNLGLKDWIIITLSGSLGFVFFEIKKLIKNRK